MTPSRPCADPSLVFLSRIAQFSQSKPGEAISTITNAHAPATRFVCLCTDENITSPIPRRKAQFLSTSPQTTGEYSALRNNTLAPKLAHTNESKSLYSSTEAKILLQHEIHSLKRSADASLGEVSFRRQIMYS